MSRYQFLLLKPSIPSISHFSHGLRCSNAARPEHQQYIIRLQNVETERHTAGRGSSNLIRPASIIGTEHRTVTMTVRMILSGSVIAARSLDIMNSFR